MDRCKNRRTEPLAKNVELVGYDDLGNKPGFQMAMYKAENGHYYLYATTFRWNGFNILDVTDPAKPRKVKWVEPFWVDKNNKDGQSTPKIQIGDGLMILAHGGTMDVLHGTPYKPLPFWGGITIWDIKTDPENPKILSKFECDGGPGVHRFFYNGGRYVYVTGSAKGFAFYILRIIDIQDPTNPVEVGRWWDDRQYLNNKKGGELPPLGSEGFLNTPQLHACCVRDDVVYMAYQNIGLVMLDVKDKTNPKLLGKCQLNPTFGGGAGGARTHTVLPLGDKPYVLMSTEAERCHYFSNDATEGLFKKLNTQPMNMIGIVEITEPEKPSLISVFPYPEMPEGYTHGNNFNWVDDVRVPFGPHNSFDAFGQDVYEKYRNRVYTCYFHAGLRIYDTSDPFMPKEIGYFMTPDPEGPKFDNKEGNLMPGPIVGIAEDVLVDDRGYIYFDTANDGLYIVRCTV